MRVCSGFIVSVCECMRVCMCVYACVRMRILGYPIIGSRRDPRAEHERSRTHTGLFGGNILNVSTSLPAASRGTPSLTYRAQQGAWLIWASRHACSTRRMSTRMTSMISLCTKASQTRHMRPRVSFQGSSCTMSPCLALTCRPPMLCIPPASSTALCRGCAAVRRSTALTGCFSRLLACVCHLLISR